jgi:chitodextrinase
VTGYEIYRDGNLLTRAGPESTYEDTSVAPGSSHTYEVRALDAAGNVSNASQPATATTDSLALLFYSGFESGNMSPWTASKGMVAQQQQVFTGSWAGRTTSTGTATTPGAANWAYRSVGSQSDLYAQTRFKILSQGSNQANLLAFKTAGDVKLLTINRSAAGKLAIRNEVAASTTTSSKVVTTGAWHTLQARLNVNGPSGQTEVWLDGVKVDELTTAGSFGTAPIGRVLVGDTSTSRTYDMAFDEVAVDPKFVADTTDPQLSDRLSASASSGLEVQLSWDAATDDVGVAGYEIYRDGSLLTTTGAVTDYKDRTVDPGMSYYYEVRARDGSANVSHFTDIATVTTPPAFDDDFETGDLSKWSLSSGLVTTSAESYSGGWGARATSQGTPTYAYYRLPATRSELYYRLRFKRLSQGANGVNLLRFRRSDGDAILSLNLSSTAKLAYRNEVAGSTRTSKTAITDHNWHEVQVRLQTAPGRTEVWLDGRRLDDLSASEGFAERSIGRIELGESLKSRIFDIAYDDVRIDTNPIPDTTPPTAPAQLTATAVAGDRVELRWTAATDNTGVDDYLVFRDGRLLGRVEEALSYADTDVSPLTEYTYEVRAMDESGNKSGPSPHATVTTPALDTTAPTTPTGLSATAASPTHVDLSWSASSDDVGVAGYDVYRNGELIGSPAARNYRDTGVTAPSDVTYSVRARDRAGNASRPSASVSTRVSLFDDGFETGDLSRWDTVNRIAVGSGEVASGQFAARSTSTGSLTSYAFKRLATVREDVRARVRFKVLQASTSVYLLKLKTATGGPIVGLYRSGSSGALVLRNSSADANVTSSTPVTLGQWHELQVRVRVLAGAGDETEVWLDGARIAALSGPQTLGSTGVGRLQVGEDSPDRTYDIAFDDVSIDDPAWWGWALGG